MQILLTNDDGYAAPGLLALKRALEKVADLLVVAPERNWSAGGHVKTMHKPLRLAKMDSAGDAVVYACSGAPSDCVTLVLLGAIPGARPDVIVSGINPHPNLGHDVTYSGTVTAAMEGAIAGVPSMAVSVDDERGYEQAAAFVARFAPLVAQRGLPLDLLLNINVPAGPAKGAKITRMGRRHFEDMLLVREDPRGVPYYWIGGQLPPARADDGTDFDALADGYISITPLQMDMTATPFVDTLRAWPIA